MSDKDFGGMTALMDQAGAALLAMVPMVASVYLSFQAQGLSKDESMTLTIAMIGTILKGNSQ